MAEVLSQLPQMTSGLARGFLLFIRIAPDLEETCHEPNGKDENGAEEEIAQPPFEGVKAHFVNTDEKLLDAFKHIEGVQSERGKNNSDNHGNDGEPEKNHRWMTAKKPLHVSPPTLALYSANEFVYGIENVRTIHSIVQIEKRYDEGRHRDRRFRGRDVAGK